MNTSRGKGLWRQPSMTEYPKTLLALAQLIAKIRFLLPALIFGAWGCALLRLKISGSLQELQNPAYHPLTIATTAILLLTAVFYPFLFDPTSPRPPFKWLRAVAFLLLLAPVVAWLALPGKNANAGFLTRRLTSLNSETSLYRLLGVNPEDLRKELLDRAQSASADSFITLDLLELNRITQCKDLQEAYQGRHVTLLGQWLPGEQEGQFRLVQVIIFCCAADAKVVGTTVMGDPGKPAKGDWFEIDADLQFDEGSNVPQLRLLEARPQSDLPAINPGS